MSTAIGSFDPTELSSTNNSSRKERYLYGKPGTDIFSSVEHDIQARSALRPLPTLRQFREDIRQNWRGVVLNVYDDEFTVQLTDLTNRSNPKEQVTLSKDEFDEGDQLLIKPGALFSWYIGYRQGSMFSRERFSIIRFRHFIPWTEQEISDAENEAREYAEFFLSD